MDIETLLNSPLASVRAFGVILPSVMQEDPEGAKSALAVATHLANGLARWAEYPYEASDAALYRVSAMLKARAAETMLTDWDAMALGNLCLAALPIPFHADGKDPYSIGFNENCEHIKRLWRNDHESR